MSERIEFKGHGGIDLVADTRGPVGAPTVVLLHGGGQTRYSWGGTAVTLAERGYRSITVDARGHGESGWATDADYTLGAFARDVEVLLELLHAGHDGAGPVPIHLVGASLGGLTSLLLLGEIAPGIAESLVLVDVVPDFAPAGADRIKDFMVERMHDGFGSLEEVAAAIATYNPHRPPPRDLSGLAKNLRERNGRWFWHWDPLFVGESNPAAPNEINDRPRMIAASRNIAVPMLLVRGRVSDLVTEEAAQQFLADVPHCRFVDVSGAGHMVAGDRNDAFTTAVVDFLAAV